MIALKWNGWTTSAFLGLDEYYEPKYADRKYYRCPKCRYGSAVQTNYCPNCGARLEKANKMKVGNLNQHCGDCNITEYCGNPYGYCLCADVRFSNVDESEYKRIAETAKVKKYEACKDCDRPDCGVYWYSEDDYADGACEHENNARDYYCKQVANYVWSNLQGEEK